MNYEHDPLLDALAAEHAIGTLTGQARNRFVRLLAQSPAARAALWRWERRFGEWAASVPPVTPDEQTWEQISARLFDPTPVRSEPAPWWRRFALVSVLASVVAFAGWWQVEQRLVPTHVAQIVSTDTQPLWVISADLERSTLTARALNVVAAELDQVYELWMLPNGEPPRSLGLLPVGQRQSQTVLPAALAALLAGTQGLAVSLEPAGGSPTGVPTGPIVHQASFTPL